VSANGNHLDPARFGTRFADLSTGVRLAYVREGRGLPLLLVHGFPQTKRIWWRNIQSLADSGFDVIAVDLRGYGDSSLAPDGHYDPAAFGKDLHELLTVELGIASCAAAGGDLGGVVLIDMALRYPGVIGQLCLFNTTAPDLSEEYAAAGIATPRSRPDAWDYATEQGTDPDRLIAELSTSVARRRYVASLYTHRLWGSPGAFTPADVDFHTEPFSDARRLRAAFTDYEVVRGTKEPSKPERLSEVVAVPTLILYGPDDAVQDETFPDKAPSRSPTASDPSSYAVQATTCPGSSPGSSTPPSAPSCRDQTVSSPPVRGAAERPTVVAGQRSLGRTGGQPPCWLCADALDEEPAQNHGFLALAEGGATRSLLVA
jgi:pimeloyl-ACP methyl ester carboxylesterase